MYRRHNRPGQQRNLSAERSQSQLITTWLRKATPEQIERFAGEGVLDPAHPDTPAVAAALKSEFPGASEKLAIKMVAEQLAGVYLREPAIRHATKCARRRAFDIRDFIVVHSVFGDDPAIGYWMHTHGMWRFRRAELEVLGVPRDRERDIAGLIDEIAADLARRRGIRKGETAQWGEYLVRFDLAIDERTVHHFGGAALQITSLSHLGQELLHSAARISAQLHFRHNVPVEDLTSLVEAPRLMNVAPIWQRRDFATERPSCFVLMPFSARWSNRIWRLIREVVEDWGLECLRADDLYGQDVMEDIWWGINTARVVVADITGRNPNVMYELGLVHTVGKSFVLLTQSVKDVPFDLLRFRHIVYEDNADGYEKLRRQLPGHLREIGIARRHTDRP